MVFKSKNKFINEDLIQIFIRGCLIEQFKRQFFRSYIIDVKITWKLYIDDICFKFFQALG